MAGTDFSYDNCPEVSHVYDKSRELSEDTSKKWTHKIKGATRHIVSGTVSRISDLGCWTGRFITLLSSAFPDANIIWVEPSLHMLTQAQMKDVSDKVQFLNAACESTGIDSESIDLGFMSMVYHHIKDKGKAVDEIRRIIRPGWIFLLRNSTKASLIKEPWTEFFPEALEVELARAPDSDSIVRDFLSWWMTLQEHDSVNQVTANSGEEYHRKISLRWLSSLQAISDEVFTAWVDKMSAIKSRAWEIHEPIDFFVFRKED